MNRQFVSIEEIAERYGVHPRTIRRAIAEGRLPAYRVGSKLIKVDVAEADAAMLERVIPAEVQVGELRATLRRSEEYEALLVDFNELAALVHKERPSVGDMFLDLVRARGEIVRLTEQVTSLQSMRLGNDGLTDVERKEYARQHREGVGRKTLSDEDLAALADWRRGSVEDV